VKKADRERLRRTYGSLYRSHHSEFGLCFYCGAPQQCRDHVPPLAWIEAATLDAWRRSGFFAVTIASCGDCNRRLSDRPLFTALERTEFIATALEREYERRAALWTDEELLELSPEFRRVIRAKREALVALVCRVRYAQQRLVRRHTFPDSDEYTGTDIGRPAAPKPEIVIGLPGATGSGGGKTPPILRHVGDR
jgi:hypothetical protein